MLRSFFCGLALLVIGATQVGAQSTLTESEFGPTQTVVTFSVQGELQPLASGEATFPLNLLDRLSEQKSLATLEATGGSGRGHAFTICFAFRSVEAFRAWYTSAGTRQMLGEIASASSGTPKTSTAVQRLSLAAAANQ